MKKYLLLLALLISSTSRGQDYARSREPKFAYYIGLHAMDDDDIPFQSLFDAATINYSPYPAKAGVLYEVADIMTLETSLSFLKLNRNPAKKYIAPYNCFGLDVNLQTHHYFYKKSEYERFGVSANHKSRAASLYFLYGISANLKNQLNEELVFGMNLGGGLNYWFTERLAVSGQAVAQIGLAGTVFMGNSNALRYSLGIIYKNKN